MNTLRQYLATLTDSYGLTRTLGEIDLCRDERGEPLYSAGNSAAVFRIRLEGRIRSLRCYLRPVRHLREIYGSRLLEKELFLYDTPHTGRWVDVVLGEWIEGETLHRAIARAAATRDREHLARLAAAFDRMAARLLADDCAHGDLKPENIIVDENDVLHPIDLDASFLPAFAGEKSPELGTAAYQHPARTAEDYDERIDDYPAALISTALHALVAEPALYDRYGDSDGLLFTPQAIPDDPPYREALALFERRGMAVQYRIARLLASPRPQLFGACGLFALSVGGETAVGATNDPPYLFVEGGLWGFRTGAKIVVPPLYDNGFDFTEGLAAMQLGTTWHYIDPAGHTIVSCSGCEAVKPFRNGRAQIIRAGRRLEIDSSGQEFEI